MSNVTSDPAVMGGEWCLAGTRVTIRTIAGLLAAGRDVEQILQSYPHLRRDRVLDALDWTLRNRHLEQPALYVPLGSLLGEDLIYGEEQDSVDKIKVFVDDCRMPPDDSWILVRHVEAAQFMLLLNRGVDEMSLDHDMGACLECIARASGDEDAVDQCEHVPTGYDLVKWMAEHSVWPRTKPWVHSMNPRGRLDMQATIDRYFPATF